MKTYLLLENVCRLELPAEFHDDDVRFAESLVEYFVKAFSREGDVIFDPFAGYGTTLRVAEALGRVAYGLEFDERRVGYARSLLQNPENLLHGDARNLADYALPAFDLSITSPPYMTRHDVDDPLTAYTCRGRGYAAYLEDMGQIYAQMRELIKPGGRAVIEVANLKVDGELTPLAWDLAGQVSRELVFEGEMVACWDEYGYGYDHSYCLVFAKSPRPGGLSSKLDAASS